MYGCEYANWTQGAGAVAAGRGVETLLRLARETQAALQTDLAEVTAAQRSASAALRNLPVEGACRDSRRRALRRLLGSYERSEASIRERLAETRREAATLEALVGRNAAFASASEQPAGGAG